MKSDEAVVRRLERIGPSALLACRKVGKGYDEHPSLHHHSFTDAHLDSVLDAKE